MTQENSNNSLIFLQQPNGNYDLIVKWTIKDFDKINAHLLNEVFFESPNLYLRDPIRNESIKFQLRLNRKESKKTAEKTTDIFLIEKSQNGLWSDLPDATYSKIKAWECYKNLNNMILTEYNTEGLQNVMHLKMLLDMRMHIHTKKCEPKVDPKDSGTFEYIACLQKNIYFTSIKRNSLEDDLREFLEANYGKNFELNNETYSFENCREKFLHDFIEKKFNEDFIIECKEKIFKIKKIYLQARSEGFNAMLSSDFYLEAKENKIEINGFQPEIVEKMIEFFETDDIEKDYFGDEKYFYVYEIARMYFSKSFLDFCHQIFGQNSYFRNHAQIQKFIDDHDDTELEKIVAASKFQRNLGLLSF